MSFISKFSTIIFLALVISTSYGQGIEFFQGTWKEALVEAQKEDKIVFVDSYAKWCGPCKKMAKNVFTQEAVGQFFNDNFINLKLDMEEADGRTFGAKYPVSAYPTLFFLDSQGNILKKVTGGQQADGLINQGKVAIKSYDKTEAYEILYNEGKRDYDLMVSYVKELNKVEKPSIKISNEYLKSNPDISKEQKAGFLMEAVVDADSKLFDQLVELKKEAISQTSKEDYNSVVQLAAMKTVAKAVEFDYKDLVDEAITQYEKADVGNKDKFKAEAYLEYYAESGNYNEWKSTSKSYLKKYGKKTPELYKMHIAKIRKSLNYQEDAKDYTSELYKNLIKRDDATNNYFEYSNFLMANKDIENASKIIKEAIKKAESRKEDTSKLEQVKNYLDGQIK